MAPHGVQGIQLNEADLTIECFLFPFFLFLCPIHPQAEPRGQPQTLHGLQLVSIHSVAIDHGRVGHLDISIQTSGPK